MQRTVIAHNKLLTDDWTLDVETVEEAIRGFGAGRTVTNDCRVTLFEVTHDRDLHVNVTHAHRTKPVSGWAGPASVADGYVNNRTFGDMKPNRIVDHIRRMVFAERA
jgi:hypothetical protein